METLRYAVVAALCLFSGTARSQAMFQVFYDRADTKPAPTVCQTEADKLHELLAKYPHPDSWRYIVVCDDKSWGYLISRIGEGSDSDYVYGDTNRTRNLTFFRGTTLMGQTRVSADEAVAHELAHIFLKTGDERRVRSLTKDWLAKYGVVPLE